MLVLALNILCLDFLLSSFLSLLQSFLLFYEAFISSMPFQSGTRPSSIAAYTTVDTDGSLCVIPLPALNLTLSAVAVLNHSTDLDDCWNNRSDYCRKVCLN